MIVIGECMPSSYEPTSIGHVTLEKVMHRMQPAAAPPSSLSKNHRLVYDVVLECGLGKHVTASDVYAKAAARRPGIGFSTVYRALTRLREHGLIAEVAVPGAPSASYEPIGEPHAHVRCRSCGLIADVDVALPADMLARVASETGFAVKFGTVSFEGACGSCLAR